MSETRVVTLSITSRVESLDALEVMLNAAEQEADAYVSVLVNHLVADEKPKEEKSSLLEDAHALGMFPDLQIIAPPFDTTTESFPAKPIPPAGRVLGEGEKPITLDALSDALGMFPDSKIRRAPDFNVATERTGIDEDQMEAPDTSEADEMQEAFNAAINFVLDEIDDAHEALSFLETWREGDWPSIRAEFPEFKSAILKGNP